MNAYDRGRFSVTMRTALSTISGLLFIIGFVPYIKNIWDTRNLPLDDPKKAAPSKVSWFIWASLDSVLLVGMYQEDALNGQIIGAMSGAWVVFILAMYYGTSEWTKVDIGSLVGGMIGILLLFTGDAIMSIQMMCLVGFIGSFPTFTSAWANPAGEDKTAWTIFFLSCVAAVLAIPALTWQDAAQPLTFTTIESIMMYILYVRAPSLASVQQEAQ